MIFFFSLIFTILESIIQILCAKINICDSASLKFCIQIKFLEPNSSFSPVCTLFWITTILKSEFLTTLNVVLEFLVISCFDIGIFLGRHFLNIFWKTIFGIFLYGRLVFRYFSKFFGRLVCLIHLLNGLVVTLVSFLKGFAAGAGLVSASISFCSAKLAKFSSFA